MPLLAPPTVVFLAAGVDTSAPGYDLVLMAHVLSAVVGLVAVVVAGGFALALRGTLATGEPVPDALVRYYRPGVNWAGRVLFAVPVFGVALLAMSGGQWSLSDTWVALGMAGWALVAVAAEAVLWPAERRLQEVVVVRAQPGDLASVDGPGGDPSGLCLRTGLLGLGLGAVLVLVAGLMVAKP